MVGNDDPDLHSGSGIAVAECDDLHGHGRRKRRGSFRSNARLALPIQLHDADRSADVRPLGAPIRSLRRAGDAGADIQPARESGGRHRAPRRALQPARRRASVLHEAGTHAPVVDGSRGPTALRREDRGGQGRCRAQRSHRRPVRDDVGPETVSADAQPDRPRDHDGASSRYLAAAHARCPDAERGRVGAAPGAAGEHRGAAADALRHRDDMPQRVRPVGLQPALVHRGGERRRNSRRP